MVSLTQSACNAGEPGSIPGWERFLGEGHGNLLQYSCLENPMDRGVYWATVHRVVEKAMSTHSSTLAWEIPWTEEPGRLQSMGSLRLRQDLATSLSLFTFMHWRRKWQPTPVFLPGEPQGWEPGGLPSMRSQSQT